MNENKAIGGEQTATKGFCPEYCAHIYPFVILFALYVFFAFLTSIPIQESELRYTLENNDGFQQFLRHKCWYI